MAGTKRDEYTYIRDKLYIHSELPTAINVFFCRYVMFINKQSQSRTKRRFSIRFVRTNSISYILSVLHYDFRTRC